MYELVVRHFLACVSSDAVGKETTVDIDLNGEKFVGHGLTVVQRNYLEVYVYERWSDKEIPDYEAVEEFEPTAVELHEGATQPPPLLTEADLIALMDKFVLLVVVAAVVNVVVVFRRHGIGTDATHAEHIETVKSRAYIGVGDGAHLVPGVVGIALCDGYDAMGFEMSKPNLRAELEADLRRICDGAKRPEAVLQEQVAKYRQVFDLATREVGKMEEACSKYLNEAPANR